MHTTPYGYLIGQGFIGFLPDGHKMLFATQEEYYEYFSELVNTVA